jgi:Protein of unknown function (DUF2486)
VHVSDPNDDSIPVLHEILVPGHPVGTRPSSSGAAEAATQHEADVPREPTFKAEPVLAPQPVHGNEPKLAPEPALPIEPILVPEPARPLEPVLTPEPVPPLERELASRLSPEPIHADESKPAPEPALAAQPVLTPEHTLTPPPVLSTHDDAVSLSAGVFDRAEPATPIEAGTIVPPDIVHDAHETPAPPALDADLIAERLRGRFAGFLTGEGRGIIEARCREALQEHSTWLVGQITREVALTLETEMAGWVKEAVEQALKEETARRSHGV